jgi:hypothetical protein
MHSTLFGNVYINILIQKECHVNSCWWVRNLYKT